MTNDQPDLDALLDCQELLDIVVHMGWNETRLLSAVKLIAQVLKEKRTVAYQQRNGYKDH